MKLSQVVAAYAPIDRQWACAFTRKPAPTPIETRNQLTGWTHRAVGGDRPSGYIWRGLTERSAKCTGPDSKGLARLGCDPGRFPSGPH
jgi:hypothetical protein